MNKVCHVSSRPSYLCIECQGQSNKWTLGSYSCPNCHLLLMKFGNNRLIICGRVWISIAANFCLFVYHLNIYIFCLFPDQIPNIFVLLCGTKCRKTYFKTMQVYPPLRIKWLLPNMSWIMIWISLGRFRCCIRIDGNEWIRPEFADWVMQLRKFYDSKLNWHCNCIIEEDESTMSIFWILTLFQY